MKNKIEQQIFEKMKAKDFGESMCNETKRKVLRWVMQKLRQHDVVGQSEQLVCPYCKGKNIEIRHREQSFKCIDCKEGWAN